MLLRTTSALRLDDGTVVAVDDGALAQRLASDDAALDAAIGDVGLLVELAGRAPAVDAAAAESRLRQLVGAQRARDAQVSIIDQLSRSISRWLSSFDLEGPDPRVVFVGVGGVGLAVLALILAIMGRGLRERFRREVVLPELRAERLPDPAEHLRRAEEALRAGRGRDAIHSLYLYAIARLAGREAIRYDPSLTDRELLARAVSIPNADALRELVELHERVWYGLREPRGDDASRAQGLATRASA